MPSIPDPKTTERGTEGEMDSDLLTVARGARASMRQPPTSAPVSAFLLKMRSTPGLIEAHERHKNDKIGAEGKAYTPEKRQEAKPDYRPRLRAVGKVVGYLQHDTPERQALLKAVGLTTEEIRSEGFAKLAEGILQDTDEMQYEEHPDWEKEFLKEDKEEREAREAKKWESLRGLKTRNLSTVIARPVSWMWQNRIPFGKLTILSGDPDLGKTWVTLDLISRLTNGADFPDESPNPFGGERRNALWVSAEDADEDTILPRLLMLGADTSRVESLAHVKHVEKKQLQEQTLNLGTHIEYLDQWLTANPLVALVVLDPLAAFLGKIDSHRNSDVRALLTPVKILADRHRVAIIGINHLSKGGGGEGDKAIYRGNGSVAFEAAARSSWRVTRDKDEPKEKRIFAPVKANLSPDHPGGLAFRVGTEHNGITWDKGRIDITADEAGRDEAAGGSRSPAKDGAKAWLIDLLKDGPVPAADVWKKAKEEGLNDKTLKTAKRELQVEATKSGGKAGGWLWSIPAKATP